MKGLRVKSTYFVTERSNIEHKNVQVQHKTFCTLLGRKNGWMQPSSPARNANSPFQRLIDFQSLVKLPKLHFCKKYWLRDENWSNMFVRIQKFVNANAAQLKRNSQHKNIPTKAVMIKRTHSRRLVRIRKIRLYHQNQTITIIYIQTIISSFPVYVNRKKPYIIGSLMSRRLRMPLVFLQ